MTKLLTLVSFSATQPNTGATATAFAGDSLVVQSCIKARAVALWSKHQVAGYLQLAFPSGHDTTRGFRASCAIGVNTSLTPLGMSLPLVSQETITATIAGSNVAGDVEIGCMLQLLDNAGVDSRLLSPAEVMRRIEKLTTVEATIAQGVGPGYTTEELINADSDLLLPGRDYAVLGTSSRTECAAVTLRGPDTGNVRIGVPGKTENVLTSAYFMSLSRAHGESLVPVINGSNKNQTYLGVAGDENNGNVLVTYHLALLK
jgi:hypothetical protein